MISPIPAMLATEMHQIDDALKNETDPKAIASMEKRYEVLAKKRMKSLDDDPFGLAVLLMTENAIREARVRSKGGAA